MKENLLIILVLYFPSIILAQNTMELSEGSESPEATIGQLAWLEGHWEAEALGGTAEEIWAAPKAGAMMGMFRAEKAGEITFYELFTIREVDSSLLLQVKHFNRDLTGWEEKDKTVDFPLVKLNEKEVWFDGLTMKMTDNDHLTVFVRSTNREGSESELAFFYRRVQ